jgi:hypothetical protein
MSQNMHQTVHQNMHQKIRLRNMVRIYNDQWCDFIDYDMSDPTKKPVELVELTEYKHNKRLEIILSMSFLICKHSIKTNLQNSLKSTFGQYITNNRCTEQYPKHTSVLFRLRSFTYIVYRLISQDNVFGPVDFVVFDICKCCGKTNNEYIINHEIKQNLIKKLEKLL